MNSIPGVRRLPSACASESLCLVNSSGILPMWIARHGLVRAGLFGHYCELDRAVNCLPTTTFLSSNVMVSL